ncbi:MAG TPA: hypothetical protein VF469_34235 [Kofleriaceae bacterium]
MTGRLAIAAMCAAWAGACGTGDDTNAGTRAECALGGALTDCPEAQRSSQGACWRLVDCGAIAIESNSQNRFTWGRCVDSLDSLTADRQRLVIDCVAASTCDELRVSGSPTNPDPHQMHCLRFGGL